MKFFYKNKFIAWNLIAMFVIKAVFSFSSFQLASIIDGVIPFSKEDIVSQTNVFRSNLGFSSLKTNPTLESAAWQKLQDMISGQYFAHTSPSGTSPWYWFELTSYNYTYAGENLAIGFVDAESTVDAWADSSSHRANLLNPNYREIGVAVAPAQLNNSSGYLVVQLFGTPKPTAVTSAPIPSVTPAVTPTPIVQSAQTTPLPTAVPTPTTVPTPVPAAAINPDNSQYVLETPAQVETAAPISETLRSISGSMNIALIFYFFATFIVFALVMAFQGLRKGTLVKTAASFALFLMAVAIPVLEITKTALIV